MLIVRHETITPFLEPISVAPTKNTRTVQGMSPLGVPDHARIPKPNQTEPNRPNARGWGTIPQFGGIREAGRACEGTLLIARSFHETGGCGLELVAATTTKKNIDKKLKKKKRTTVEPSVEGPIRICTSVGLSSLMGFRLGKGRLPSRHWGMTVVVVVMRSTRRDMSIAWSYLTCVLDVVGTRASGVFDIIVLPRRPHGENLYTGRLCVEGGKGTSSLGGRTNTLGRYRPVLGGFGRLNNDRVRYNLVAVAGGRLGGGTSGWYLGGAGTGIARVVAS